MTDDGMLDQVVEEVERLLAERDGESILRAALEQEGAFDRDLWNSVRDLGWLAVSLPEDAGGLGLGAEFSSAVAERIGYHLGAIPFSSTVAVLHALINEAGGEQRALATRLLRQGAILTAGCFERGVAAMSAGPKTRIVGGRLTGLKVAVPAALFADAAIVAAADESGALVAAFVWLDQEGVERLAMPTLDNSRGYADLVFDAVPAAVVGTASLLDALIAELAILSAFEQAGGARACLDRALAFAKERIAFGRPIAAQQSIKHGLADMYVLVELARGAAQAARRSGGRSIDRLAAAARLAGCKAYDLCAQESIQIHGAIGATWEAPLHLHYRRARCLALEWGGAPVWRSRLLAHAIEEAQ